MKKYLVLILFIFSLPFGEGWGGAFAQDIHFTQYYASPLTLNPAQTGFFKGKYRGAINYRNQWSSVIPNPYVTMSGSVDMLMQNKIANLGVGIMLFNDKSGDGALTNTSVMVSFAAHKKLGKKHQLSLGLQAGYVQKSIDYSALTFNNQYTSNADFDPNSSSKENTANNSFGYPDFEAGLLWSVKSSNKLRMYAGFSVFHLTKPTETFFSDGTNKLNSRNIFHGGLSYSFSKKVSINPNFLFMSQSKAQEFLLGMDLTYRLSKGTEADAAVFAGSWYRYSFANENNDALMPTVGVEYKKVRVGVSYDVNVSSLKSASHAKGGLELSLIYILDFSKALPVKMTVPCLRM